METYSRAAGGSCCDIRSLAFEEHSAKLRQMTLRSSLAPGPKSHQPDDASELPLESLTISREEGVKSRHSMVENEKFKMPQAAGTLRNLRKSSIMPGNEDAKSTAESKVEAISVAATEPKEDGKEEKALDQENCKQKIRSLERKYRDVVIDLEIINRVGQHKLRKRISLMEELKSANRSVSLLGKAERMEEYLTQNKEGRSRVGTSSMLDASTSMTMASESTSGSSNSAKTGEMQQMPRYTVLPPANHLVPHCRVNQSMIRPQDAMSRYLPNHLCQQYNSSWNHLPASSMNNPSFGVPAQLPAGYMQSHHGYLPPLPCQMTGLGRSVPPQYRSNVVQMQTVDERQVIVPRNQSKPTKKGKRSKSKGCHSYKRSH